jgi:hypothetical protein
MRTTPGNATGSAEKRSETLKRATMVAAVLIVAAVGVLLVLNRDCLFVHSGVAGADGNPAAVPTAENRPPEVVELAASTDRIEPFTITKIKCVATDLDGDLLSYAWSAASGELFGEGPEIEWGSPTTEGLYKVSVIVDDGRGGTVEQSVSFRVKANAAPEIPSLTADADWVAGGGTVYVSCEVTDADGDEVTLELSATGGSLYGQGAAVVWLAPDEEAVHWVTVVARDSFGAQAERKISISVTSGEPPEILELNVEGVNTDLLVKRGDDWHVYRGRSFIVTCVLAEESDGLAYEWTLESFHMAGDGPITTYTAPSGKATQTVAVTVTDQAGNVSSASIIFHTETCACSF